jgi:hypothetical protein
MTRGDEGPGTARAALIIPEPARKKRKDAGVDSEYKPVAVGVYRDALNQELPSPIQQLLTTQKTQISLSHEYVREQLETLQPK